MTAIFVLREGVGNVILFLVEVVVVIVDVLSKIYSLTKLLRVNFLFQKKQVSAIRVQFSRRRPFKSVNERLHKGDSLIQKTKTNIVCHQLPPLQTYHETNEIKMLSQTAVRASTAASIVARRGFHSTRAQLSSPHHYPEGPRSNLPFDPMTKSFKYKYWTFMCRSH